jgi:hypothetical protein
LENEKIILVVGNGRQYDEYDLLGLDLTEGDKEKLRDNNITPDMLQQLMGVIKTPELKLEELAQELQFYKESNNWDNKHKSWSKKKFYE